MRSSASTPNPTPRPLRLLVVLEGEDHPKACTGRRLLHRGLAEEVAGVHGLRPAPIVLDPHAHDPISERDRAAAERGGVLVVDCSWNRLAGRGRFPSDDDGPGRRERRRRLPFLLAANPQHFGRLAELNTVEALSAAVYLLGRPEDAAALLEGFRGGPSFLDLNVERLRAYRGRPDPDAVRAAERSLFGSEPRAATT